METLLLLLFYGSDSEFFQLLSVNFLFSPQTPVLLLLSSSEVPASFHIIIPPVSDGAAPSLNSSSVSRVDSEKLGRVRLLEKIWSKSNYL